jgi:hypothetical protein
VKLTLQTFLCREKRCVGYKTNYFNWLHKITAKFTAAVPFVRNQLAKQLYASRQVCRKRSQFRCFLQLCTKRFASIFSTTIRSPGPTIGVAAANRAIHPRGILRGSVLRSSGRREDNACPRWDLIPESSGLPCPNSRGQTVGERNAAVHSAAAGLRQLAGVYSIVRRSMASITAPLQCRQQLEIASARPNSAHARSTENHKSRHRWQWKSSRCR